MRKILFFGLFLLCSIYCMGQNEREERRRESVLYEFKDNEHYFLTDSVYSFFSSFPFKPFQQGKVMFEVEDRPIPFDTIQKEIIKNYMLAVLEKHYKGYSPSMRDKNRIIPALTFRKMMAAIMDPKTNYSEPITHWNAARLGEEGITSSNFNFIKDLANKRMKEEDNNKYETYINFFYHLRDIHHIHMSAPVFDEDYNYAFLIFKMKEPYCFALFERKENEWCPILVSSEKNTTHVTNNFKEFITILSWW